MKEPSSISHECPAIVQSCNITNSLPTPANSSSPTRAVTEGSPQLLDDDQAPHSSQLFSPIPSHDSARRPLSPNTSNVTTLEAPNSKDPRLKSSDSAAISSHETLAPVIVKTNSSSVEDSGIHEAHQDTEPDDNSSNTRRLIHHGEFPAQRAKAFRRRHATEPLHSPKLMSPVKALKKASQHPTRKPLFPSSDSTLNQQQTPPAVRTNPKPARPLWEQTPPPTPPNTRKKRYVPADERKQRNPELSRHVLPKDREPDDKLIEYGRLRQTYDRHLAAPYAFRYCGKLWADYHYLAELRGGDGRLLWDEVLGRRLRKK